MHRYVLAGAGSRARSMFVEPLAHDFEGSAQLVGVFDPNPVRAGYLADIADAQAFTDFGEMLDQTDPDTVLVATVDGTHHEYIIRALEASYDVITEKPMTIDAEKCRAVLDAERRTGKHVTVIFNMRWGGYASRARALLQQGVIGEVLSADLEWFLDTRHGADYFRRWHRRMANSGGLLVHKATHHFDLMNWLVDDEPASVFARGDLRFYGPTRAKRGVRCSTCPYTATCEFFVDYAADPDMQALYFSAEHADGYYRDGCVFADEIDIYDTMSVSVRYTRGALLTYSLIAYSPYEGWRATLTGTSGRMELEERYSGPGTDAALEIIVHPRGGERTVYPVERVQGTHGGSDAHLREQLFGATPAPDPLGRMAGSWAGAMSLLIGAAANRSIALDQSVNVAALLAGEQR